MSRNNFFHSAGLAAVLFTAISPLPGLRAQPAEHAVHSRFLLIFDTSADMKKRVPAVVKALNTMLVTSLSGQLHAGDTVGVWTFNQDLHPGDFPLQVWNPEDAAMIASNLTYFIGSRKYANNTRFEALQPLLNRVVRSSERLTVLVFSDGATKITGTTFDTGINQLFEQNAAAQKKAREPFVVVLRSQQGKYTGCTVSLPPQMVGFPQFPPLPEPPPEPKPLPAPLPAPAVVAPSLFITGTNIENRSASPVAKPAPTNPPPVIEPAPAAVAPATAPVVAPVVVPPVAPVVQPVSPPAALPVEPIAVAPAVPGVPTNPPAAPPVVIPSANPIVPSNASAMVPAAIPVAPANARTPALTNNPVVAVESQAASGKKTLLIVAVCLLAAGVLTALAAFYFRRPDRRSLISRSMHDR